MWDSYFVLSILSFQSYMDSEIRAIMAQYMPLENQDTSSHQRPVEHADIWNSIRASRIASVVMVWTKRIGSPNSLWFRKTLSHFFFLKLEEQVRISPEFSQRPWPLVIILSLWSCSLSCARLHCVNTAVQTNSSSLSLIKRPEEKSI
jgi:hypothetical protein